MANEIEIIQNVIIQRVQIVLMRMSRLGSDQRSLEGKRVRKRESRLWVLKLQKSRQE